MPVPPVLCLPGSPCARTAVHGGMTRALRARRREVTRASQARGQVLIWFLAFAATLAVVFAGVYSVGQVTSEKQKVVNAIDAATYSGALTQARALNLASYTNRAMVANEVLIAQMVSLDSWTSYFEKATENYQKMADKLAKLPYVGVVFKGIAIVLKAANLVAKPMAKVVDASTLALVKLWDPLFKVWYVSTIMPAFTPPVMALAATQAAQGVLRQNVATQDGRQDTAPRLIQVTSLAARNEFEWNQLFRMYKAKQKHGTSNDDRKYAAEMLLASRDEFSTDRPGSGTIVLNTLFGNSAMCIPFVLKVGSDKKGPTKLVDFDRWEAQDTVEHVFDFGPTFCTYSKHALYTPEGWGRATASSPGTAGNRLRTKGGAGDRAYKDNHANGGWSGVKEVYDVKRDDKTGKPQYEEATYALAAAKEGSAVRTNEKLGFMARPVGGATGSPDLKAGFAKDQVASISEARIFFSRPVRNNRDITAGSLFRADGHQEYASIYNPYWQVNLTTPSISTRGLVYGFGGMNPLISVFAQ